MKLLEKISGRVKKAALAGFLTFAGASTTSAHPRVGVGVGGPAYVARDGIIGRSTSDRGMGTGITAGRASAIETRDFTVGATGKK